MSWLSNLRDRVFGKKQTAPVPESHRTIHKAQASSFADPADVREFKECKLEGKTDHTCFGEGDNGKGCWGDNTAQWSIPMCALPPEDMIERWDSQRAAKHKKVLVRANGREVVCILADRMPARANIKNGAGIDLNPAASKALGLRPPFMVDAEWEWAEATG